MPRRLPRWAGAAAGSLACGLCLVLTPVQSRAWNGNDAPPLVRAADPLVSLLFRLRREIAPGVDDYHFFGRIFFLVYLLSLVPLWSFHVGRMGNVDRRERAWFRVLAVSLLVGAVGDVGPYWGGIESPWAALFLVEELSLVAIMVGAVGYGAALLHSGGAPRWLGWLFVAAGPGAILMSWLTGYFPHGPMLLFTVAVATAGAYAVRSGPHALRRSVGPKVWARG
jgi:hypothetical protein